MRTLTIKRAKKFVASLGAYKVYLEDPENREIEIAGIPCRKLGVLKNGEEQSSPVDEQSRRVFVIGDKLSKNYCNDYYDLPAGTEDLHLSGSSRFSLTTGNAFVFDNNPSAGNADNRKKNSRIGLIVLIAALLLGALAGRGIASRFLNGSSKDKVFSANGMTVTLTKAFHEEEMANYSNVYSSPKVLVLALKEGFDLAEGLDGLSVSEYAQLAADSNRQAGRKISSVTTVEGIPYFHYDFTNTEEQRTYSYHTFMFKGPDAFWLIQFITTQDQSDELYPDIVKWAKSIRFE